MRGSRSKRRSHRRIRRSRGEYDTPKATKAQSDVTEGESECKSALSDEVLIRKPDHHLFEKQKDIQPVVESSVTVSLLKDMRNELVENDTRIIIHDLQNGEAVN